MRDSGCVLPWALFGGFQGRKCVVLYFKNGSFRRGILLLGLSTFDPLSGFVDPCFTFPVCIGILG